MKILKMEPPTVSPFSSAVKLEITVQAQDKQAVVDLTKKIQSGKKPYDLVLNPIRDKRSLSANAYAWVLMDKIAKAVRTTKEAVYREIIRKVGSFNVVKVKSFAADRFIERWELNGIGWVAEKMGREEGMTDVVAYYGSSTYDTDEMARLIDEIVTEAKELGIETMPPEELEGLIQSWRR